MPRQRKAAEQTVEPDTESTSVQQVDPEVNVPEQQLGETGEPVEGSSVVPDTVVLGAEMDGSCVTDADVRGGGDLGSKAEDNLDVYSDAHETPVIEPPVRVDPRDQQIQKLLEEQSRLLTMLERQQQTAQVRSATELSSGLNSMYQPAPVPRASVSLNPVTAAMPVLKPSRVVKSSLSKCPRFNGETEWNAFLVQFQAWLRLNHYDGEDCRTMWCDMLGLALDGEAQLFYSGLSDVDRTHYETLIDRLEQRYSGSGVVEVFRAKLQNVPKRQPGESLEKLRDSVWLMARKAYPELPRVAQEQLATDALMRAVDYDLRIQCTMKECKSLDDAVAVMQRYEAVQQTDPEKRRKMVKVVEPVRSDESGVSRQIEELCSKMTDLLDQQVKAMESIKQLQSPKRTTSYRNRGFQNGNRRAGKDECFQCGQKGHFARDCPQKKQTQAGNATPPAQ